MQIRIRSGILWLLCFTAGCDSFDPSTSQPVTPAAEFPQPFLREYSAATGLEFRHNAGTFEDYEMPTIMGSGGAMVDFDLDGLLDLYLVNGRRSETVQDGFFQQRKPHTFRDVLPLTGIIARGFGMGAWWGDYDNDGFPDLFLTNVGPNQLFHNQGDGTFSEVPLPESIAGKSWSTAASWSDINADGFLDLGVVNYVDYIPGQYCEGEDGRHDFCGPAVYPGSIDRLFENQGTAGAELFVDRTIATGVGDERGKGLGLLTADLNGDRLVDLFVTNDGEANRLWLQQTDGTFRDDAELLGVAVNFLGEFEASMGVVASDWNNDDRLDLFITHLTGETNTLYLSEQGGLFQDESANSGLGSASLPYTGFGIGMADFDHDGRTDLAIGNGSVKRPAARTNPDRPVEAYRSPNQLLLQDHASFFHFSDISSAGGEFTTSLEITRSVVTGDIDRDGDVDLLVTNCAGPAQLYENVAPKQGNWLTLKLIDTRGNRDATGAQVRVLTGDDAEIVRQANPYQGYLSTNDSRLHFGLGKDLETLTLQVEWSDGTSEVFEEIEPNQHLTLIRGRDPVRDIVSPSSNAEGDTP